MTVEIHPYTQRSVWCASWSTRRRSTHLESMEEDIETRRDMDSSASRYTAAALALREMRGNYGKRERRLTEDKSPC